MPHRNDANDSMDRRSVLKAVGASAVGGVAFSGSAIASQHPAPERLTRIKARFADPVAARETVAEHADVLLDELADRGVLATASVSAFPAGELLTPGTYSHADEGATVRGARIDGEWDAEVATSTETESHTVELVVQPNRGRSYALVDPKDGGDTYRLTSDQTGDVSIETHCHYESQCLSYFACNSGSYCQRQERHCCDDDGDGVEDNCTDWYNDGCCMQQYCS